MARRPSLVSEHSPAWQAYLRWFNRIKDYLHLTAEELVEGRIVWAAVEKEQGQ